VGVVKMHPSISKYHGALKSSFGPKQSSGDLGFTHPILKRGLALKGAGVELIPTVLARIDPLLAYLALHLQNSGKTHYELSGFQERTALEVWKRETYGRSVNLHLSAGRWTPRRRAELSGVLRVSQQNVMRHR